MARDRDDDLRDDYDDRPARPASGGMDGFFGNTALAIILSIVFFCICSPVGLILGIIGLTTCKNPDAKRNAMIMTVLAAIGLLIGIASIATNNFGMGGGFGPPQ
jgi:hypothetical protein